MIGQPSCQRQLEASRPSQTPLLGQQNSVNVTHRAPIPPKPRKGAPPEQEIHQRITVDERIKVVNTCLIRNSTNTSPLLHTTDSMIRIGKYQVGIGAGYTGDTVRHPF